MVAGQRSPVSFCKNCVPPGLKVAGGRGVCENAKWQEVRTPEPGKPSLLVARRVPPGWAQGGREAGPLPDDLTSSHVISNFLIAPPSHIKEVFSLLCFALWEHVFIIVLLKSFGCKELI